MRVLRPVVRAVGSVTHQVRNLARLQEVARILIRYGLGSLVAGVPGMPSPVLRRFDPSPARACAAMQELGPTFVKLGQVLATRPDILSKPYITAFEQLLDDVDPVPFEEIDEQLTAQFGAAWREKVAEFDETPLATASIAQVHRGKLVDGRQIVFKIQRPRIEATIRADLSILFTLASRILVEFPEARSFDPYGTLEEFDRSISAELDFMKEADNMRRFIENFAGNSIVKIPTVVDELTTEKVLCMEFLDGTKIREAREAGCSMDVVGQRFLTVAYDMLFLHGFFHGDLHSGNVVVLPENVIGLLDFGMVGRLTQEMRNNVISIIFGLQRGDFRTIARLFYEIAIKDERVDYHTVERDAVLVMEKHWAAGGSVKDMQIGPFVMDLAYKAAEHGARVPSSYTMFFKAIVTSEGLAKALIEEVDPIEAAIPYFQQMMMERLSPDQLKQEGFYTLLTLSSLINRLPVTIAQFLEDLDKQRLRLTIKADTDWDLVRARDRRQNRVIFAAFTVLAFLCGTLMLLSDALYFWGIPFPALMAYHLGGLLFLVTLAMMVRNHG
ncbi:MAG: AarF/ABC1/UbiB kinase family protein [Proteobacteria bacterium]|nr:AarF/ABC1/UbiB kinase family protein [Pseudomonadota bacterium]